MALTRKIARYLSIAVITVLATLIVVRIVATRNAPPLQRWHTQAPKELSIEVIERSDWNAYLAAEQRAFDEVRREVTDPLPEQEKVAVNRYYAQSPLYPANLTHDWNRSFVLEPEGTPVGAVVLLHGLSDSPYSLRHVADHYRDHGYVAVAIRLPAHGTVPAALVDVQWRQWRAATRLAMREARRRAGPGKPLHLVGYSTGASLAVDYSLDALEDPALARANRLVMISPMIGVRGFARYAGIAGWPAILPRYARTAWMDLLPEFNPFKYSSFPLNAARQAYLLSDRVQTRMSELAVARRLDDLPPILCFQSVTDSTVSAPSVVSALFDKLPANGSEIVLFDVNRTVHFGPLLDPSADTALERLLTPGPRRYRLSIIGNLAPDSDAAVARTTEAGRTDAHMQPLGLTYPANVFSMSHVALPFPVTDSLYGSAPDPAENYGVNLGAIALRGERGTFAVSMDNMTRVTFNPFFPYVLQRIDAGLADPAPSRHDEGG
ncbi:MAG: alpha/beta fold hydrolase [Xanthomonadaceae bacterium]|nr:alpha/beta fold hydrolase [Xanthomonadaceae bacterium]